MAEEDEAAPTCSGTMYTYRCVWMMESLDNENGSTELAVVGSTPLSIIKGEEEGERTLHRARRFRPKWVDLGVGDDQDTYGFEICVCAHW